MLQRSPIADQPQYAECRGLLLLPLPRDGRQENILPQPQAGEPMKLSTFYRAGIQHIRPLAELWLIPEAEGDPRPRWGLILTAVLLLVAGIMLGGIIAPR